jgi:toxin-antitoxin system PIN domain toxin
VIAVDTNILVYAHRQESSHHQQASAVVRSLAEGAQTWAIPWPCIYEFISVVTNPRIWKDTASLPAQAWQQISGWTQSPTNVLLSETEEFLGVLERFVQRPRIRGGVVHDARIAALCVAHGVEVLLSADRDFALFQELKVRNPLQVTS